MGVRQRSDGRRRRRPRPGRRQDRVSSGAPRSRHRESLESIALDDPLGRVEQRARGSFCVSSRTAHLTRNRNDVTLLPDSVTPYRKRSEQVTTVDWSLGHYEHSASQLLPAAEVVVERAMPVAGERVVDVGCGTGNAALLAAARGARVTGVDPAGRLLEVARDDLFAPHGFSVTADEHSLSFTAASASDYLDAEYENHPLVVAGRAVLEPRGEAEALRAQALEILEAANEDPAAFRVTNRYIVATAERT